MTSTMHTTCIMVSNMHYMYTIYKTESIHVQHTHCTSTTNKVIKDTGNTIGHTVCNNIVQVHV